MAGIYIPGLPVPQKSEKYFAAVEASPGQKPVVTIWKNDALGLFTVGFFDLVPVPDHGRLIDADALYKRIKTECNPYGAPTIGYDDGLKVLGIIGSTPPIIPADEEKT